MLSMFCPGLVKLEGTSGKRSLACITSQLRRASSSLCMHATVLDWYQQLAHYAALVNAPEISQHAI